MTSWDYQTDVVVVGSGAGGMTAALTAKLEGLDSLILEKTEYFGGSTAMSGGGIWIPNNHLMAEAGLVDSFENARIYMQNTVGDRTPAANQEAFLINAPKMVRYLAKLPHLKFQIMPGFSDYYPERPGGTNEGRGLDMPVFRGKKLGSLFKQMRKQALEPPLGLVFTIDEVKKIFLCKAHPRFVIDLIKPLLRNIYNIITRADQVGLGASLACRLRLSLYEQNVPLWLNTAPKNFIFENGIVVGVEAEKEGKKVRIRALKGVVLAAGGFPHNEEMRRKYQKAPVSTAWTAASPGNTGEVIQMGIDAGAEVDLMEDSWGMPTILPPGEPLIPFVLERSYPGSVMVNSAGHRFVNEATSYVDIIHAMYDTNREDAVSIPAFFIMDQRFRNRYFLGSKLPGPLPKTYYDSGFVIKADTLEALAEKNGIDPTGLASTIKRFNEFARNGKDLDFGRGDSAYDHYYSDPTSKPNRCLAPLEKPPFYSIKIFPGDIGTKGGLVTNEHAQVLDKRGAVIEGLYAVGNTSASVMGNTYPGSGSTIGPAMTFGYIAAMHLAKRLVFNEREHCANNFYAIVFNKEKNLSQL